MTIAILKGPLAAAVGAEVAAGVAGAQAANSKTSTMQIELR
jgi:hypothetical protein